MRLGFCDLGFPTATLDFPLHRRLRMRVPDPTAWNRFEDYSTAISGLCLVQPLLFSLVWFIVSLLRSASPSCKKCPPEDFFVLPEPTLGIWMVRAHTRFRSLLLLITLIYFFIVDCFHTDSGSNLHFCFVFAGGR